jgi:hypothetical protein
MTATKTPLAPIVKTQFAQRITHGGTGLTRHRECWGAETADGVWDFEREDSPGTPWLTYHKDTRKLVNLSGTLRQARIFVASGGAQRELDRLLAHDRGEHKEQRDPRCGRC